MMQPPPPPTATVTEGVLDPLGHAVVALDEEEHELWRQLRRKRDFEGRVAEKRAQLTELRDRRRGVSTSLAEAAASVEHLSSELNFLRQQEREMEHDIAVLKESNRILQNAFQAQQPAGQPPASPVAAQPLHGGEVRDAFAEERARRESAQAQHEQIAHLRQHLERLRAEKVTLQQRQQSLFDRQRSAEQDRNRLIGSLQDDRSGINELRAERLRLWEERAAMEREMARVLREVQATGEVSPLDKEAALAAKNSPPSVIGGVRVDVVRDTPQAFVQGSTRSASAPRTLWEDEATSGTPPAPVSPRLAARQHWTGFADAGVEEPPPPAGGAAGLFLGGATAPPSFSHLSNGAPPGPGPEGPGVTEWSGALRDFKAGSGGGTGRYL